MKYLFLALSTMLAIVAQMIAGNNFFLFNFFDLSLVLIAYWALYRSRVQALFVGSLSGLLMDATLGWPLGYNGFGRTLAAFAIGAAARRFNLEGAAVRFATIAVASALSSASMLALFAALQRQTGKVYLGTSLAQALITGAVGSALLSVVDNYNNRVRANRAG
jgi:rod shape-determining protein MreD